LGDAPIKHTALSLALTNSSHCRI